MKIAIASNSMYDKLLSFDTSNFSSSLPINYTIVKRDDLNIVELIPFYCPYIILPSYIIQSTSNPNIWKKIYEKYVRYKRIFKVFRGTRD